MGYGTGRSLGSRRSLGTRIQGAEQQAQSLREAQELAEYTAWVQTLTEEELMEECRQLEQRRSDAMHAGATMSAGDGRNL